MALGIFSLVAMALSMLFHMPHSCVSAHTYEQDVYAINYLYFSLGFPPLPGWSILGGDPCGDGWQGVECVNSNITAIILNGANLGGRLGDKLVNFTSLITLDLSNNQIGGTIPARLPVTMRKFFLSANQLTGTIPGSLSELTLLSDMSLNNNLLSGELPDAFQEPTGLVNMDISNNNLSGILPPSMGSLPALTTLHVQNNRLSGMLDVLQDLPLQDLNIENNLFSGPIPEKLLNIPNLKMDGNPFNTSVAPSPLAPAPQTWPFSQAPAPATAPVNSSEGPTQNGGPSSERNKISTAKVVGYVGAGVILLAMVVLMVMLFVTKQRKRNPNTAQTSKSHDLGRQARQEEPRMSTGFSKQHKGERIVGEPTRRQECKLNLQGMRTLPMPPLIDKEIVNPIIIGEEITRSQTKSLKRPTLVRPFSVASLQQYTNSFSEDNLVQDGRLGHIYLAELQQEKLLAVLKLDNRNAKIPEDDFLKLVSTVSRIQHQNIVELVGYSVDFNQRLLVYNHFSYTTLYDVLHNDDDLKRKLTWKACMRIALGAAKALEYLHEGCQPPVVHQRFDPSSVLINDDLAVQVSECGLAALPLSQSANELSARAPAPFSYDAPEVNEFGFYTEKSDVYSFGIVMLELLTGRKPFDSSLPRGEQHLVRWASSQLYDINALTKMMDPTIGGQFQVKSLSRFADIIGRCIQEDPEFRPPMSEVVQDLARVI